MKSRAAAVNFYLQIFSVEQLTDFGRKISFSTVIFAAGVFLRHNATHLHIQLVTVLALVAMYIREALAWRAT